jgi:hypothetical protein
MNMQGMTIRSLCIEIFPLSGPYETGTLSISVDDLVPTFALVGIAVQKSSENCEARMHIDLGETPFSAKYGDTTCYTGAWVKGEISIAFPGVEDLHLLIDKSNSPPFMVTKCPASPLDAPVKTTAIMGLLESFSQVWSYDFLTALIRSQQLGNPFVIQAARVCVDSTTTAREAVLGCLTAVATVPRSLSRDDALNSLRFLGPAARPAVPELISLLEALDNPEKYLVPFFEDAPGKVAETLKMITGQDFGTDTTQWREWWESQP